MSYDDYDESWESEGVRELKQAADRLEEFDPELQIPPKVAFLQAKWLRSHAGRAMQARGAEQAARIDTNALELARHINGGTT